MRNVNMKSGSQLLSMPSYHNYMRLLPIASYVQNIELGSLDLATLINWTY
jgi:hypothetical protein